MFEMLPPRLGGKVTLRTLNLRPYTLYLCLLVFGLTDAVFLTDTKPTVEMYIQHFTLMMQSSRHPNSSSRTPKALPKTRLKF